MKEVNRFKVLIDNEGNERKTFVAKDVFTIGRSVDADIVLNHELISRQHLRVSLIKGVLWIEDLGSSNGSWLNERRLPRNEKCEYFQGDHLALGSKNGPLVVIEDLANSEAVEEVPIPAIPAVPKVYDLNRTTKRTSEIEKQDRYQREIPVAKVANGPTFSPRPVREPSQIPAPAPKYPGSSRSRYNANSTANNIKIPSKLSESRQNEDAHDKTGTYSLDNEDFLAKKILHMKNNAEKVLFNQIRDIVSSEAEEIRQVALEEAKAIRQKAILEADRCIQEANEEALHHFHKLEAETQEKLRSTEEQLNAKLEEWDALKFESDEEIKVLEEVHNSLAKNVEDLKKTHSQYEETLLNLRETIKQEEERIQKEFVRLDDAQNDLKEKKKEYEIKLQDLEYEERQVRAKIETELIEAKLKVTHVQGESAKYQTMLDSLVPEVEALSEQKESLETQIQDILSNIDERQQHLDTLNKSLADAEEDLRVARDHYETTHRDLENEKEEFLLLQNSLSTQNESVRKELVEQKILCEKMIVDAKNDSEDMILKANSQVKELADRAEILIKDAHSKKMLAESEARELTARARELHEDLVNEARAEAKKIKAASDDDAFKIKKEADKYYEDSKIKSDGMIEELKGEIKKRNKESYDQIARLEQKKIKIEAEINTLASEKESKLQETQDIIQSMLDSAHVESQAILSQTNNDVIEMKKNQEEQFALSVKSKSDELNRMIETSEARAKEIIAKAEKDGLDLRAKQQTMMAELKNIEAMKIKEMKNKAEDEIQAKKQELAKSTAGNVYSLVVTEFIKLRNQSLTEETAEKLSHQIKDVVKDTMLGRVSADQSKLSDILKISIDSKGKEKAYWKKWGIIGGSVFFVLMTIIIFPGVITGPKDALVSALQPNEVSNSDLFLKKLQETRAKSIYAPATTEEYKESYVDNVLYTTDYVTKLQDQAFQDKWILDLNDWFIKTLDVKDTTIIKFVSLENALIRDLLKLKEGADPANPEPKIEEMRARELEFRAKLSEIFEDPEKVSTYYRYSQTFWKGYHYPRQLNNP